MGNYEFGTSDSHCSDPSRNRPGLVVRAAVSALEQSFRGLEVIVVIDGPDPATFRALSEINDPRLHVIALEESVGGAEARNVGARAARGQWIALLDDDDEWLPPKIEKQLAGPRPAAWASACCFQVPGTLSGPGRCCAAAQASSPKGAHLRIHVRLLCYFQTSTFFCSRDLFLQVPFRKDLKSFQDIDWFFRVNSHPGVKLEIVPEPLSVYYSPEQRATITGGLNWERRLAWGQQNRSLMTRRAYSRFITGSCAGTAVRDRAGVRALGRLLVECVDRLSDPGHYCAFVRRVHGNPRCTSEASGQLLLEYPEVGTSRAEPEGLHT